ncbi:HPr family phosphocarrier protein [Halobacteriales archaeon SW_10_66_29]|nr:MAG: HPr family phosphocarrier protein [Halobacteriales archaeon SW_10_66_29]
MERIVTVVPEDGLHARPASKFVQTAGGFDATVTVSRADGDGSEARADSMLAVTGLGVRGGNDVRLVAEGPDAEEALDALEGILTAPADELEDGDP